MKPASKAALPKWKLRSALSRCRSRWGPSPPISSKPRPIAPSSRRCGIYPRATLAGRSPSSSAARGANACRCTPTSIAAPPIAASAGFAARAAEAAALGFGAIKIAPFDNLQEGYARIAAVADAIAGRAELQVDCHWRFDEARAQEALGECARLGVTWFECPLPETPEHFAAIKRLRGKANAAGMRLAGAEQFIGTAGFRPLLEQGLYDVVMPDVKYAGGLAECLRIAQLAARHGVACSLHNPSGPVCHAHSLHASAAMESNERLEYQHGETPRFYEIAPGLAAPVGGSAALPGPINVKG